MKSLQLLILFGADNETKGTIGNCGTEMLTAEAFAYAHILFIGQIGFNTFDCKVTVLPTLREFTNDDDDDALTKPTI